MDDYPLIEDHGLIGDLQTAALVTTDATIDWFCCPRFDSPSVFGALLDRGKGGHFSVRPAAGTYTTKQLYHPDTAVLVTRFMTEAGAGEVVDFMPVTGTTATDRHRLVRMLRCVRGSMTFEGEIAPRFDYGRKPHQLHLTEHGAVFTSEGLDLALHAVREPEDERLLNVLSADENDVRFSLTLRAGQQRGLIMESAPGGPPQEVRAEEFDRLFHETVRFWRTWLGQSTYSGRWREAVERSAVTLKLMTYAPTGALVAAPTAGLPEQLGGERNWGIGNGAATQLQLDIYGEALDSIYFAHEHGMHLDHGGWKALHTLLDWLVDHWDQPGEGLWETRGGRKDFTYGRVMSWVAFDRALRMAHDDGRPAAGGRWVEARDAIYRQVFDRGWDPTKQAFVQHYGDDVLDSALLRMPTVGFLTPDDPMWKTSLDAMERELVSDSLVYRYNPEASPDGLRGSEGTFSLCTFMYVDALARAGRTDMARLVLEKMLTYANHLGLYSEEIDLTGRQLGNFPQAFTHLALIDAAITLDRILREERRPEV
ncbi:glycoside hydrolase family 15 protein [Streptomyces sp. NPDC096030]|uniref:glycoside hydrolase family 15 protein n=1 Tax=Streptomyces sp. NPDC096030 TaxID=3155423 RepID=UPI00331BE95A